MGAAISSISVPWAALKLKWIDFAEVQSVFDGLSVNSRSGTSDQRFDRNSGSMSTIKNMSDKCMVFGIPITVHRSQFRILTV